MKLYVVCLSWQDIGLIAEGVLRTNGLPCESLGKRNSGLTTQLFSYRAPHDLPDPHLSPEVYTNSLPPPPSRALACTHARSHVHVITAPSARTRMHRQTRTHVAQGDALARIALLGRASDVAHSGMCVQALSSGRVKLCHR